MCWAVLTKAVVILGSLGFCRRDICDVSLLPLAEAHVIGAPCSKIRRTKQGLLVQLRVVDAVRKPRQCN